MKIYFTVIVLMFACIHSRFSISAPGNTFGETHNKVADDGSYLNEFHSIEIQSSVKTGEEGSYLKQSLNTRIDDTIHFKLVVSGTVTQREEIWDRRSNPMMGRPDFLKEIVFHIKIDSVYTNAGIEVSDIITVSAKDHHMLLKCKALPVGELGIFKLHGDTMPFILSDFDSLPGKTGKIIIQELTIKSDVTSYNNTDFNNTTENDSLSLFERIAGKVMLDSIGLQQKAVRFIAKKYGMKNAEFVSLTSYSGPCPPDGGYVYWGVRGQIKGKWYIWQAEPNSKLIEGEELTDPKRYQKCNSPQTMITTPSGYATILSLKIGDTVLSGDQKPVRILAVSKVRAGKHSVCHIVFDDGTVIEISPKHPLADGRLFGDLQAGDRVNGKSVVINEMIPYTFEYTYDILPDSPSGTYFVNGIEIASTMKQAWPE